MAVACARATSTRWNSSPSGCLPYWYQQLNRNLGRLPQHSNGVLSRLKPQLLEKTTRCQGRPGVVRSWCVFGEGKDALIVVMMHLALRPRPALQLGYIRELIGGYRHQV